jgi:hypothetical protein
MESVKKKTVSNHLSQAQRTPERKGHPYTYRVSELEYRVSYLPGESDNAMFGGNSKWRGPIWMPVNMRAWKRLP